MLSKKVRSVAMKKIFLGLMLLALAIMFIPSGVTFAASKDLKIAMVQWRGETEACRGFKDALKEMGYSVQYTVLNAGQDRTTLGRLLREELLPNLNNFDYVYSYGTTASKMTKTALNNKVPHVFSNVAAPVESEISDSMQSSGGNMSGTSNRVPLSLQIETAIRVVRLKTLGIMFNPREKNAMVVRENLHEIKKKYGFHVIDLRSVPGGDSLQENLQKLSDRSVSVDAVYLPLDSYHMTEAKLIGSKLRSAKIITIAAQKKYIENGALFGAIPDYYALGKDVAGIVDRHQKGEALINIPIVTPKEPLIMINKTTSQALKVEIPKDMLAKAVIVE
jgi:putative tryptophan/tyrosine transport system substrate-binding protein